MIAFNIGFLETPHLRRSPPVFRREIGGGSLMSENNHDLCSACSYASACRNRSTSNKHVFECEEYCAERRLPPTLWESPSQPRGKAATDRVPLKGLCTDCENRKHCVLRVTEGGVWHCEEYC